MSWTHRTIIVPASLARTCRALADGVPGAAGMWTTPLSPTGEAPVTHYISAGHMLESFVALLEDPQSLSAATGISLAQATSILSACTVSPDQGRAVMAAMGLTLCERVQINDASRTALEAAPGVGPVKAQAIIDGRPWADVWAVASALNLDAITLEHWYA